MIPPTNGDGVLRIHIARKEHRCDSCGRLIEVGMRYWRKNSDTEDFREHTNCEDFKALPLLPEGFNKNRSLKATS